MQSKYISGHVCSTGSRHCATDKGAGPQADEHSASHFATERIVVECKKTRILMFSGPMQHQAIRVGGPTARGQVVGLPRSSKAQRRHLDPPSNFLPASSGSFPHPAMAPAVVISFSHCAVSSSSSPPFGPSSSSVLSSSPAMRARMSSFSSSLSCPVPPRRFCAVNVTVHSAPVCLGPLRPLPFRVRRSLAIALALGESCSAVCPCGSPANAEKAALPFGGGGTPLQPRPRPLGRDCASECRVGVARCMPVRAAARTS